MHAYCVTQIPQYFAGLRSLLWPTACIGCGAPDLVCCAQCVKEVVLPKAGVRAAIEAQLLFPKDLLVCCNQVYSGTLRRMLVAYKHEGRIQFLRPLGEVLLYALEEVRVELLQIRRSDQPVFLVALPSTVRAVRERGFHHLEQLLTYADTHMQGGAAGAVFQRAPNALAVLPGRRSQVGLHADERQQNARLIRIRKR